MDTTEYDAFIEGCLVDILAGFESLLGAYMGFHRFVGEA
jgi:hypothetical protein